MDEQDTQDIQDGTLLHDLQSNNFKMLIIKDLIRISRLQFPQYIPLFVKESIGPARTLADETVRPSCGLDRLRVCPICRPRPSNRRSIPLPPPSGLGQRAEMRSLVLERYGRFASRVEGFRGWRAPSAGLSGGVVQPLRWWLSDDTDAMWLDRYGEDADQPFFHGLAERLRRIRSVDCQPTVRGFLRDCLR